MYIVKYGRTVMTSTGSFAADKNRAMRFDTVDSIGIFLYLVDLVSVFAENDSIVIVEVN